MEVEEDSIFYDGKDLRDEEWVQFLALNRPFDLHNLMEKLEAYDEEKLRLALHRERCLRKELGSDWADEMSASPEKISVSCPSSPVHNSSRFSPHSF